MKLTIDYLEMDVSHYHCALNKIFMLHQTKTALKIKPDLNNVSIFSVYNEEKKN